MDVVRRARRVGGELALAGEGVQAFAGWRDEGRAGGRVGFVGRCEDIGLREARERGRSCMRVSKQPLDLPHGKEKRLTLIKDEDVPAATTLRPPPLPLSALRPPSSTQLPPTPLLPHLLRLSRNAPQEARYLRPSGGTESLPDGAEGTEEERRGLSDARWSWRRRRRPRSAGEGLLNWWIR